jgi:hypothetical protein
VQSGAAGDTSGSAAGHSDGTALLSRVEVTAAAIDRDLLLALTPPLDDILGDAIVSWELALAGFEHQLSSAHVHRMGPDHPATWGDATGSVPSDLAERLRFFRPDLFERLTAPAVAPGTPTPDEERADPVGSARRWRLAGDDLIHRLGAARCLRHQGRIVEAVDVLGEFEPTELVDDAVAFVAELAWLLGDQGSAIELVGSRPALADTAEELGRLARTHAELMDDVESAGCRPYEVLTD